MAKAEVRVSPQTTLNCQKLILPSHKNALNTARGVNGLYLERNAALVYLYM